MVFSRIYLPGSGMAVAVLGVPLSGGIKTRALPNKVGVTSSFSYMPAGISGAKPGDSDIRQGADIGGVLPSYDIRPLPRASQPPPQSRGLAVSALQDGTAITGARTATHLLRGNQSTGLPYHVGIDASIMTASAASGPMAAGSVAMSGDFNKQPNPVAALTLTDYNRTLLPEFNGPGSKTVSPPEIKQRPVMMMEMISQIIEQQVTQAIRKQAKESHRPAPEPAGRSPVPAPEPADKPPMPAQEHFVSDKQARLYLRQMRKLAEEERFRLGLLR